jgi:hypothetical protein
MSFSGGVEGSSLTLTPHPGSPGGSCLVGLPHLNPHPRHLTFRDSALSALGGGILAMSLTFRTSLSILHVPSPSQFVTGR